MHHDHDHDHDHDLCKFPQDSSSSRYLLKWLVKMERVTMAIQSEMVVAKKELSETQAGMQLDVGFLKEREEF